MKVCPIIPEPVSEGLTEIIQDYCPISFEEHVEDDDPNTIIYKYVGFSTQEELVLILTEKCACEYKNIFYKNEVCSLYENADSSVCIFLLDNVLSIMISSSCEQHEAVMEYYTDIAKNIPALYGERF